MTIKKKTPMDRTKVTESLKKVGSDPGKLPGARPQSGAASMRSIVAKKLAVEKLVTAKRLI